MAETKHGYLVLADISGYTGYLAQVELEHAQDESYEHLGTIPTRTYDLLPRYEALVAARNIIIPPKESEPCL